MNENRGPWYLLTGLVIGFVLGLSYAWLLAPVQYTDTAPGSLREDFQGKFRALIAVAYAANGDLARAQARLALLDDPDIVNTLAAQAQRTLAEGGSPEEVRLLGLLASIANQPPGSSPVASATTVTTVVPATASATDTETASATPSPSLAPTQIPSPTPSATPSLTPLIPITATLREGLATTSGTTPTTSVTLAPSATPNSGPEPSASPTVVTVFEIQDRRLICDQDFGDPMITVQANNAVGEGLSGVEVVVSWPEGEEHIFTGLKPELGLGYADFKMTIGVVYTLSLVDGNQPITDLTAAECQTEAGERIWGVWQLIFVQP